MQSCLDLQVKEIFLKYDDNYKLFSLWRCLLEFILYATYLVGFFNLHKLFWKLYSTTLYFLFSPLI